MRRSPLEPMVVVCAANGAYALPLAVMLRSVVTHLAPERRLVIYVIDDGISADDKRRVVASLSDRAVLHWLEPQRTGYSSLPLWGRMTLTTYDKLLAPALLPASVEKAIWLDCDLLALSDVTPLWDADLAGHHVLAAQDALVPYVSSRFGVAGWRELGLPADAKYFNAGVLVMDCARWRADGVTAAAFDYLRRFRRSVFFWDQEALNAVLSGRWGEVDPRWNCNLGFERPLLDGGRPSGKPAPWILHFSGNLKPWAYSGTSVYDALYLECLDATAWRGQRPPWAWRSRLLCRYESSPLRRLLFPAEQWGLRLLRRATLRYASATGDEACDPGMP